MDELDRLYRRLVHNVRAAAPELLNRPFEVSQVYQELVPYRTNRRDLDFAANDEYELALCQLLAGSRGYLTGDAEMQGAMRRELDSPNPDLALYRAFATASVALAADPLREVMLRPTPEGAAAVANPAHRSPLEQASLAGRPTEQVDPPSGTAPAATTPANRTVSSAPPATVPVSPPALPLEPDMPVARPHPVRPNPGDACRFCATRLPEGRPIVFCPGCGHNLTIKHCPACSAELEVGWKFCVTCGREI